MSEADVNDFSKLLKIQWKQNEKTEVTCYKYDNVKMELIISFMSVKTEG